MPDYEIYYELEQSLQRDPALIPSPELYNFDDERVYAAMMDRLAQPLPSGEQSPFSARTPGSAHAIFMGNMVYLQSLIAHELNLTPDASLLVWMRLLGTQLRQAEYPIVNVRFTRSVDAISNQIRVEIPVGLEVRSSDNPRLSVFTIADSFIDGVDESVVVSCRLNIAGSAPLIKQGEFSILPRSLPFLDRAGNEGEITPGRNAETILEAVLRTRDWLKTGNRCVTDRDYQFYAINAGAAKSNMIRGRSPQVDGFFRDLRTVAVYPASFVDIVRQAINPRRLADERLVVTPAEIIPIDGLIQIRAVAGLSELEARNLAVTAIVTGINPPAGIWGDREIGKSIASAMERVQGIYATPTVELKHSVTGVPVSELTIEPWALFQVQQSIQIEVLR